MFSIIQSVFLFQQIVLIFQLYYHTIWFFLLTTWSLIEKYLESVTSHII